MKKVLFVLTSHDQLGNTGEKTGFWVEEFASPYYHLADKNISITIRAAGSGLSGGSLNDSVVVDISNINSLLDIDLVSMNPSIHVEPGMLCRDFEKLESLQFQLQRQICLQKR